MEEDLRTKPAAQIAFREAYYSGYGPAAAIQQIYERNAQRYRDLYYRLHAEVDGPIDRVRRAVTGRVGRTRCWSGPPITVTCWAPTAGCTRSGSTFTTRPPGFRSPSPASAAGDEPRVVDAPTSHVDLGADAAGRGRSRRRISCRSLRESSPRCIRCPGDLMPVVDGAPADDHRAVYLMTRDNMLEGDSGASGLGRQLRQTSNPPAPLRIRIPAHTAANSGGLVVRVDRSAAPAAGHRWKLVRSFDDPSTWTEPGVRHLAANGLGGEVYRTSPWMTSGASTTSAPTRPRRRTAGTIRPCTNCAATCGCGSSRAGPTPVALRPQATVGHTSWTRLRSPPPVLTLQDLPAVG